MNAVVRSTSHSRAIRRLAVGAVASIALLAPGITAAHAGIVPASLGTHHSAAAPYCGIVWGSLPETATFTGGHGNVYDVRAGRHACFDRLVIDISGPFAGYRVSYVDAVRADGSGRPVAVAGGARLEVIINAPSYDNAGNATYRPRSTSQLADVRGWTTFRQVASAGSFEGRTTLALGVRARLPMRVFVLPGADHQRLVIDVAHRWS